jgi:hypothetical protein
MSLKVVNRTSRSGNFRVLAFNRSSQAFRFSAIDFTSFPMGRMITAIARKINDEIWPFSLKNA